MYIEDILDLLNELDGNGIVFTDEQDAIERLEREYEWCDPQNRLEFFPENQD